MALLHARHRLWTRDELYHMVESGVLSQNERVELIEGEVVLLTPQDKPHADAVTNTNMILTSLFGRTHLIRVQLPLDLCETTQPEPDFAIVPRGALEKAERHPTSADLVVEIASSSLAYDREVKTAVYARAGIREYWILNIPARQLETYREPSALTDRMLGFGYRSLTIYTDDQSCCPLFASDVGVTVRDLF